MTEKCAAFQYCTAYLWKIRKNPGDISSTRKLAWLHDERFRLRMAWGKRLRDRLEAQAHQRLARDRFPWGYQLGSLHIHLRIPIEFWSGHGSGGFARVLKAEMDGQLVAVKLLLPKWCDPADGRCLAYQQQLIKEGRFLAKTNHRSEPPLTSECNIWIVTDAESPPAGVLSSAWG